MRERCRKCGAKLPAKARQAGICSAEDACLKRRLAAATKNLNMKPFIGMDPDAEYRRAQKMGDPK